MWISGLRSSGVPATRKRPPPLFFRGQTLSQWSTSKLDEAAHRDTEEASVTKLSGEAFGSFFQMLDESMPKAARELLVREEIWA